MANTKRKRSASADAAAEDQSSAETAHAEEAHPTEEWIFTLSSLTGEIAKVERVDKAKGERQELSEEEYAALAGLAGSYADPTADPAYAGYDVNAEQQVANAHAHYEAGYYQAVAEYEAALAASSHGYTPEEAAYLQGLADYEAMLG